MSEYYTKLLEEKIELLEAMVKHHKEQDIRLKQIIQILVNICDLANIDIGRIEV